MVEMAIVLPFLLVLTLGIVEMSYYIYTYSELENATRRASERASKTPPISTTNPNDANDKCAGLAKSDALNGVFLSHLKASDFTFAFPNGSQRQIGDQVEASVSYRGQFLTPIGQRLFGNTFNFRFTSRRTITDTNPPRGFNDSCGPL